MHAKHAILTCAALAMLLLAGCAGTTPGPDPQPDGTATSGATTSRTTGQSTGSSGRITLNQAGSSTVLPIAKLWAEEFGRDIGASIVVGGGGSGAGIQRFCRGELDIADASRPMRSSEADSCRANGITPFELQVAIDGLSVVVAKGNAFVDCLTVQQLNRIWTADPAKQVSTWRQLNPAWPDQEIQLFGPGTDSGTFDYFVEVIITPFDGAATKGRSDYTPSEDDNVLVQGVASSPYALGYFGLAYARENADKVKIVKIDEGKDGGCVEPTDANVESGAYSPLSRPLFMYTNGKPAGVIQRYFQEGFSPDGQALVQEVGYIRLPASRLSEMNAKIA